MFEGNLKNNRINLPLILSSNTTLSALQFWFILKQNTWGRQNV